MNRSMKILKATANPVRLQILFMLEHGEVSVGEMEKRMKGVSQSSLSQHLGKIRKADMVKTRRDAQRIYYSLDDPHTRALLALIRSQNAPKSQAPIFKNRLEIE